jgi:hypothetical protein
MGKAEDADFETLVPTAVRGDRRIVFLMGGDGLAKMRGKNAEGALVEIGYTKQEINKKLQGGHQFRLVVMPGESGASPATWENAFKAVAVAYPELAGKISPHLTEMKRLYQAAPGRTALEKTHNAFNTIAGQGGGESFAAIAARGPSDPGFMTLERFQKIDNPTLRDVRAFLYFTAHFNENFNGSGHTLTIDGRRGLLEYLAVDKPIAELNAATVVLTGK